MNLKALVVIILMSALFTLICYFLAKAARKQVIKDWNTLYDLEKRSNEVTTLQEVTDLHKEFVEKASKIHNEFITPRLTRLDGYLRGMYKALGGKINE